MTGLVIDLFAGGGGASTALEAALGRPVDIAINHDATALAVHKANHPRTSHLESSIWEVRPEEVTRGRPVWVLWASPDCTHFSNAKGDVPRSQKIRSLAWSVVRWAKATRPELIFLENVSEFRKWGPLTREGRPCKERMGNTFNSWVAALKRLGYQVDWKVLDASEYGAPTKRRRLFVVARRDGLPVWWPTPTHAPKDKEGVQPLGTLPVHTAAECIDWTIPCRSIFGRKKPLAHKTMRRIAYGVQRFVLECGKPFIVQVNHGGDVWRGQGLDRPLSTVTAQRRSHALVAPTLIQTGYGERPGQRPRVPGLHKPLGTIVAKGVKHALIAACLIKHYGDPDRKGGGGVVVGSDLREPLGTVTARDHHSLACVELQTGLHVDEVRRFLKEYAAAPLSTQHRGFVTVDGQKLLIGDIGLRMLEPHELLRAQFGSFAESYSLELAETKEAKVRLIGNSVPPEVVKALIEANLSAEKERAAS